MPDEPSRKPTVYECANERQLHYRAIEKQLAAREREAINRALHEAALGHRHQWGEAIHVPTGYTRHGTPTSSHHRVCTHPNCAARAEGSLQEPRVPDYCGSFGLLAKVLKAIGGPDFPYMSNQTLEVQEAVRKIGSRGLEGGADFFDLSQMPDGPLALAKCIHAAIGREEGEEHS